MLFLVLVCITIPALIYLFLGFKSTSQAKSEMSTIDQSILLLIKYGRFERGKPGYTTTFSKNNNTLHLYSDKSLKLEIDKIKVYETKNPELIAAAELRIKEEELVRQKKLAVSIVSSLSKDLT